MRRLTVIILIAVLAAIPAIPVLAQQGSDSKPYTIMNAPGNADWLRIEKQQRVGAINQIFFIRKEAVMLVKNNEDPAIVTILLEDQVSYTLEFSGSGAAKQFMQDFVAQL